MKPFRILIVLFLGLLLAMPEAVDAQWEMGGGKKGRMKKEPESTSAGYGPMHRSASREVQERFGLIETGLRPVYPKNAKCLEVKSHFASKYRFDNSMRRSDANHGYHGGFDISSPIGTPLVAIADGEVVHKYEGGRLVGKQIFLRHAPDDTGLPV